MGDSLDPADFLATALRQSRAAIADDGFTARVARRVQVMQRRKKLAYGVRVVCAISTVFLAGVVFGIAMVNAARLMMIFGRWLHLAAAQGPGLLAELTPRGLPSWGLALGAAVIVIAVAVRASDRDPTFRF